MPTPEQSYRGYVYLIGSARFGWYKIGKSIKPDIRVNDIGVLLPFKIELFALWGTSDHSRLECAFHEAYAKNRINGEWFSFGLETFRKVVDEYPPYYGTRLFPVGLEFSRPIMSSTEKDLVRTLVVKERKFTRREHFLAFREAVRETMASRGLDPKIHRSGPIKEELVAKVKNLWDGPLDIFVKALQSCSNNNAVKSDCLKRETTPANP